MEGLRAFWSDPRQYITRHWLGILVWIVGGVVTVVGGQLVVEWFDKARSGPEKFTVFVVGGKASADGQKDFAHHMKKAIEEEWRQLGEPIVNERQVTVEYREDNWDPTEAEARSSRLVKRDDVVMVIGHFASSTSKPALRNYLGADPKIPVILTTETNPYLLPEQEERNPVFRLWPTDKEQARALVDFAIHNQGKAFWVVEDTSESASVYSSYLARQIVENLQGAGKTVVLWSDNKSIPPVTTLKNLQIDSVIFPGEASSAIILANQVREIWPEVCAGTDCRPRIYLTDGSLNSNILKKEEHLKALDRVYISHPDLRDCEAITLIKGSLSRTAELARDAALIARSLIEQAKGNLEVSFLNRMFGVPDVGDLRRAIIREMAKGQPYQGANREYRFGADGINEEADFKLWQISQGKFVLFEKQGIEYREKRCPSMPGDSPVFDTWVSTLITNLQLNQEFLAEKFVLLQTAAVLTGKVLSDSALTGKELAMFADNIKAYGSYFGENANSYLTDVHAKAVRLGKVSSALNGSELSEDEKLKLIGQKEELRKWFNANSFRLTKLFKEQSFLNRRPDAEEGHEPSSRLLRPGQRRSQSRLPDPGQLERRAPTRAQ